MQQANLIKEDKSNAKLWDDVLNSLQDGPVSQDLLPCGQVGVGVVPQPARHSSVAAYGHSCAYAAVFGASA